ARACARRPARAHGRAAQDLADPDRARDDRPRSVRAPARRRGRGGRVPGGEARRGAAAAGGAEARAPAAPAAVPASRRDDAGSPAGSREELTRICNQVATQPGTWLLKYVVP